jgi:hypothetical protein
MSTYLSLSVERWTPARDLSELSVGCFPKMFFNVQRSTLNA